MNPYWGKDFFQFFNVLFFRFFQWIEGDLPFDQLASDEVQILVLSGIAISSALVGSFLVFKRMTMLANSLSHTILLGIVVSYLIGSFFSKEPFSENTALSLPWLLLAALIAGVITTLLTQLLIHVVRLQEDASIGLVFTTLFALGIVLVTVFTRNMHMGTEAIMGNVDALHREDIKLVFFVLLLNLLIIGAFFKEFLTIAFDPACAASLGMRVPFFNYLLMFLTAATSIGAFRAVGVLLVLAFLVGPVLAARLLTNKMRPLILLAAFIGVGTSLLGSALSRHLLSVYQIPISTAGLVVSLIGVVYFLVILLKRSLTWKVVVSKP